MAQDDAAIRQAIKHSLDQIAQEFGVQKGELNTHIVSVMDNYELTEEYYEPSEKLIQRLDDYWNWRAGRRKENAGRLLEQITLLAFMGIQGYSAVYNYPSYAHQHDLILVGENTGAWANVMNYLLPNKSNEAIIVEAKNTKAKVNDQQFERLCSIMQNKFTILCALGVFITRNGATGFPKPKSKNRKQALIAARATQVLFHASEKKFVVVITENEFDMLKQRGGLLKLLKQKIQEVELATGLDRFSINDGGKITFDLPPYLLECI